MSKLSPTDVKGPSPRCPVCGSDDFTFIREIFDDRYGNPGMFHLDRCTQCGHLITHPLLQESDLGALYGTYYPRKSISSKAVAAEAFGVASPVARLRRWLSGTDNQGQYRVRRGERMLDVGSGSGLSLLEAQALGAMVWGLEADPNVQRLAAELGLQVHKGSLRDRPFSDVAFDLIIMNQVIEHIPQPQETLALLRARLAPGGRVVLVFPNVRSLWCKLAGAKWINWHVPYHLHHFNATTFRLMAERSGFQVRSMRSITPNIWSVLQLRASRYSPKLGEPSPIWAVAPASPAGAITTPRRTMRKAAIGVALFGIGVVNRFVDALGLGDSLMVELVPDDRT